MMRNHNPVIRYEGGAKRESQEGKGRLDLVSPFALMRLARWYEEGAKKYEPRNWEKGMPFSHCVNSCMRHLLKYLMGMRDEDHLAAVAWNAFALMHYEEMGMTQWDDLPHYFGSTEGSRESKRKIKGERPRVYLSRRFAGRTVSSILQERQMVVRLLENSGIEPVDPLLSHFPNQVVPDHLYDRVIDTSFEHDLGLSGEDIVRQCKELLEGCDAVLILTGDEISSGTWLEFGYARYRLDIPVVVVSSNPTTWTVVEASYVASTVVSAVAWLKQYFFSSEKEISPLGVREEIA